MPLPAFQFRTFILTALLAAASLFPSFASEFNPADWAVFPSSRADRRHVSSRGIVQTMLEGIRPACEFSQEMPPAEFPCWQEKVREAMKKLMKFPSPAELPEPVLVKTVQRERYRVEKWESYPLPGAAVPFLVLIPDTASEKNPVPVLFCIPGSDQTKEELAAETSPDLTQPSVPQPGSNAMAYHYVRQGWAAVVVDNAGTGEEADAERAAGRSSHDYENLARFLLEMDWSWLGYTSYTDQCVLDWVKTRPWVQKNRIILSGFSLGTEPMMVLGVLNPDIFAFVYNDFLCRTLERAKVMTMPSSKGVRSAPNSIRHLIPGFWQQFDFPDIVAALAPRPVICTEGGLDRDFKLISAAYRLAGAPDCFQYHHQPRFADAAQRWQGARLPAGLDRDAFFRLANVDTRNHFFKKDLVIPWIQGLLNKDKK
ncbi:alpha/beta hydrolase family protein [uncultured Akkermansia sp.]|uniref:alpha/beta hydrolase family protein n=1 Tax=uncultured Akkermansia sp. TaxID=512294 RepID=UPI00265D3849|nr:alpha/beta hydrolase family protein [uncultured Akkermansia sp.]